MRAAILLVMSGWGCAGDGKPGPGLAGDTALDSGGEDSGWSVFVPTEGAVPGEKDTDGPELWVIADDADALDEGQTRHEVVSGSGQILDGGSRFEGTIDYLYSIDGDNRCDATIALSGVPADETLCDGCDFLFRVDSEVVEDDDLYTCNLANLLTFVSNGVVANMLLGFAPTLWMYGHADWAMDYQDVLVEGWGFDYRDNGGRGYDPYRYVTGELFDGPYWDRGWASYDDGTLTWGYERYDDDVTLAKHSTTCAPHRWYGHRGYLQGTRVSDEVNCTPDVEDGWGFSAQAGDVFTLTVDAPNLETDFDVILYVYGSDGCEVVSASGNFVCTGMASIGSTGRLCATARFVAPETGDYEIWISSRGDNCSPGDDAEYDLYVDLIGRMVHLSR